MSAAQPYEAWQRLRFPTGSADDAVDEAHADLAYWDAMTADAVIPLAKGRGRYDPGLLDFRAGLARFRSELLSLQAASDEEASAKFASYLEFVDALIAVHIWAAGD